MRPTPWHCFRALADESAKVARLPGHEEHLEFNAEDLVQVCWPGGSDYDSAKMKVKNARLEHSTFQAAPQTGRRSSRSAASSMPSTCASVRRRATTAHSGHWSPTR